MEYYGPGAGHLLARSNSPQHRPVYDLGGGAGKCGQLPLEKRSAVALANFVPHIPQEVACIAELRACHLVGWSNDSSLEEEDDEQMEEEDGEPEGDEHKEAEGQGEADPESPSYGMALEQDKTEQEVEPQG